MSGFDVGSIEASLSLDRDDFAAGIDDAIAKGQEFDDSTFTATADLDSSPLEAAIAADNAELDALAERKVSVGVADDGSFRTLGTDVEGLASDLDGLGPSSEMAITRTEALLQASQQAGIGFQDFEAVLEKAGIDFEDMKDQASDAGVGVDVFTTSLAELVARGDNLKSFWSELEQGAASWDSGLKLAALDAEVLDATTATLGSDADRLSGSLGGVGSGGRSAGAGLTSGAEGAESFGASMPSLLQLAIAGAPALIALGGAAIGVAGALTGAALAGAGALAPFIGVAIADSAALHPQLVQIEDDLHGWASAFTPIVTSAFVPWLSAVVPGLQSLSPIIAATGEEVKDLGVDFDGVVNSGGWTQFVNWVTTEGPPSIDAFVTGIGHIGDAIASMAENGTPVINMLDSGWKSLTQDLENFGQSNTFRDFVSWLQSNLPVIGSDLESMGGSIGHVLVDLEPMGQGLLALLTNVVGLVGTATTDVKNFLGGIIGPLESVGHGLDDVMGSGVSGLQKMADAEASQVSNLAAIIDKTKDVSSAQEQAATAGLSLVAVAQAHTEAMQTEAQEGAQGIAAAGSAFASVAKDISTNLDSWNSSAAEGEVTLKSITQDISGLGQATSSAFDSATSIVSAFGSQTLPVTGKQIADFYSVSVSGAQTFTTDIQKAISDGYNPNLIAQLLEAGPAQAGPVLQGLVANASSSFVNMVNASQSALSSIGQEEIDEAKLTQKAINATSAQTTADYSTAMELLAQISADGGQTTVDNLAAQLNLAPAQIETILTEYKTVFDGGMANIEGDATTGGSTTAGNLAGGLTSGTAGVQTAASDLGTDAYNSLFGVVSSFTGLGNDAGQGFVKGLEAEQEAASAAAWAIGGAAAAALAGALQAASPSKVTTATGVDFGQGLVIGIQSQTNGVAAAASALGDTAATALAGSLIGSAISSGGSMTGLGPGAGGPALPVSGTVTDTAASIQAALSAAQTEVTNDLNAVALQQLANNNPTALSDWGGQAFLDQIQVVSLQQQLAALTSGSPTTGAPTSAGGLVGTALPYAVPTAPASVPTLASVTQQPTAVAVPPSTSAPSAPVAPTTITIAPTYHINGSGLSQAQLQEALKAHDAELLYKVRVASRGHS